MSESFANMTLEELIDFYTQKLKAVKALQAGTGGATKALARFNQALEGYDKSNTFINPETLNTVQEIIDRANFKENVADLLTPDLRRELRTLTKVVKALKDSLAAINSEPPDAVKLHKAYTVLQSPDITDTEIIELLPALDAELQEAQKQLGSVFGVALRDQLAEMGIKLNGRPPRFEVGRFEILTDFASRKASISYGKIEVARGIPLSLDRVLKAYLKEVKTIEDRAESGETWIEQFYQAWSLVNLKNDKASGRVNIVDCYYEMVLLRQKRTFNNTPSKNTFTDYSRAQFVYDFAQFVYSARQAYQGWVVTPHVATKSQAESASKSMWIVTGSAPHDGQYIAGIEFEESTQE